MDNNKKNIINPSIFYSNFYSKDKIISLKSLYNKKSVFIVYFIKNSYKKIFVNDLNLTLIDPITNLYKSNLNDNIFICISKMGSPAVSMQIENLIYMGFDNIIHIGLAGSFSKDISVFDFVISTGAYAETIVPYLYMNKSFVYNPNNKKYDNNNWFLQHFFSTSDGLTKVVMDNFCKHKIKYKISNIFTTDLFYKETYNKFENLLEHNAKIVEMEGASIYSISNNYNKKVAGLYIISDTLVDKKWQKVVFNDLSKSYNTIKKIILNFQF